MIINSKGRFRDWMTRVILRYDVFQCPMNGNHDHGLGKKLRLDSFLTDKLVKGESYLTLLLESYSAFQNLS